jgi:hypothetical protein
MPSVGLSLAQVLVVGVDGALAAGAAGVAVLLDPLSPPDELGPLSLPLPAAGVAVLVDDAAGFASPPDFLFEPPLYASAYQPEPLRMKLAELMSRRTASAPHEGHTLVGSSDMR